MRALLLLVLPAVLAAQAPDELFRQGRYDEARTAYQARLVSNKADHEAMSYLGRIASIQNKFGEAEDWFEKALKLDDKNARYHLWLGNAVGDQAESASKLKQPFMAKRIKSEFEKAVALDPTLVDAREGLVGFYSQAPGFMGGSMDKAREQAGEISKLNPMRGQLALARIAAREKDLPGEETAYRAAVTVAPDSAQPYYSLASFYRRTQKWDSAMVAYERLMKAKPDEFVAHLGWGAVSAHSGTHMERGERELKQFLATAPKDHNILNMAGAHFRLGQIYEKTSRRDQAKAMYSEAVKINPQHAEAKKALEALK